MSNYHSTIELSIWSDGAAQLLNANVRFYAWLWSCGMRYKYRTPLELSAWALNIQHLSIFFFAGRR